jgi:DNA repair protein RecO (recombination protein O)
MLFQEGNRIKIAYFQPLTILEIEAVHKKQRHFRKFQGNKIASAFHSIHSDIYKSTMVMFNRNAASFHS